MALKFTVRSFQALSGRLLGKVAPPTAAYVEKLLSQEGIRRFWLCSYGTICQHSHVRTQWHHSWFSVLSRACVTVRHQSNWVHSQSIPFVHQHLWKKISLHQSCVAPSTMESPPAPPELEHPLPPPPRMDGESAARLLQRWYRGVARRRRFMVIINRARRRRKYLEERRRIAQRVYTTEAWSQFFSPWYFEKRGCKDGVQSIGSWRDIYGWGVAAWWWLSYEQLLLFKNLSGDQPFSWVWRMRSYCIVVFLVLDFSYVR